MDWQEAMDHFLPDDVLLKKHKQLKNATKIERAEFPGYIPQETIREILTDAGCKPRNFEQNPMTGIISVWYWAPDTRAQAMALDFAYKLEGKNVATAVADTERKKKRRKLKREGRTFVDIHEYEAESAGSVLRGRRIHIELE